MTLEIVLPNRIGDAILTLPALLALKQLQDRYGLIHETIILYPPAPLFSLFEGFNLFHAKQLDGWCKAKSWINPARETFFLYSSSQILGHRTQKSYGQIIEAKRFLTFDQHLGYLCLEATEELLPQNLISHLKQNFGLSLAAIRYFGICLEMGYTVQQLIDTFEMTPAHFKTGISDQGSSKHLLPEKPYLAMCLEAAYGRRKEAKRRWSGDHYLDLAERIHEQFQLPTVFLGLQREPILPDRPYLIDMRRNSPLSDTMALLSQAIGYIGNDSGLLHLSNLLGIPSLGIYLSTRPEVYGPIFPQLNTPLIEPENPEPLMEWVQQRLATPLKA